MILGLTPYEWLWLAIFPSMAISAYHIARNGRRLTDNVPVFPGEHPRIMFLFAAVKDSTMLQQSVETVHKACKSVGYAKYSTRIVLANDVPVGFVCRATFKARQLQYALRWIEKDTWTLHLDEDSHVTPQCIGSILAYIKGDGNPVAMGPTVYPPRKSLVAFLAEIQRQWNFYWLKSQMERGKPQWLNGGNLLIRSDVEQEIGWDFGDYICEDSCFGYAAAKKYGKCFGWHGGMTLEQPPATIRALVSQRKRWFYGGLQNLSMTPASVLPRRIYSLICWSSGFLLTLGYMLSIPGYFAIASALLPLFFAMSFFWRGRYLLGLYVTLRYTDLSAFRRLLYYVALLALTPVVELICSSTTILAVLCRPRTFTVTAKELA